MARPFDHPRLRFWLRILAALLFVGAGVDHFAHPAFFRAIVPPGFPNPAILVAISGVCEIIGGCGLLIRPLRRVAGWGLIALLIAVFPANIYMAVAPERIPDMHVPHWLLWLRLPLQLVLIAWIWDVALRKERVLANAPSQRNCISPDVFPPPPDYRGR